MTWLVRISSVLHCRLLKYHGEAISYGWEAIWHALCVFHPTLPTYGGFSLLCVSHHMASWILGGTRQLIPCVVISPLLGDEYTVGSGPCDTKKCP